MGAIFRSWWQQIKQRRLIILGVAIILVVAIALIIVEVRANGTGFAGKTLWDWLQLLAALAIPVVVGFGAVWFTTRQGKVADAENKDNQRENALQAYIDKMSELLLKEHLDERTADGKLKPEYERVRNIARVRTITVLTQLDARRIGDVNAFLREAGLMSTTSTDNVVRLADADFHAVNWSQAELYQANLSQAHLLEANLFKARLAEANLSQANLNRANLSQAHLLEANLFKARLAGANLSGASLSEANLSEADLMQANLSGADLRKAVLSGANFSEADLTRAVVTEEQLKEAKSLQGATMPNGSKHD